MAVMGDHQNDPQQNVTRCFSADGIEQQNLLPPRDRCMSADDAVAEKLKAPAHRSASFTESLAIAANWVADTQARAGFCKRQDTLSLSSRSSRANDRDEELSEGSSVGYFDSDDFLPTDWERAIGILPPVGFAVVASGLALFHPLMFIAGALTAFGTVRAVGVGYDCCVDGSCWKAFMLDTEDEANRNPPLTDSEKQTAEAAALTDRTGLLALSDITVDTTEHDRVVSESVGATAIPQELPHLPAKVPSIFQSDPSSLKETSQAHEWMAHHYPPLAHVAVEKVPFIGLNAKEFFSVFFANDAPYSFEELQKKRQDKNIQFGLWEELQHVQQPSLHHKAVSCTDLDISRFKERILKFEAKTNTLFGPPYANTTKVQRGLVASKRLVILESKTTVANIPFGERFHVMERWIVVAEKDPTSKKYVSYLTICSEVFFTKTCPFEAQIKTKSKETIIEIAESWCKMAHQALKLTEQHRLQRIRNEIFPSDLQRVAGGSDLSSLEPWDQPEPCTEDDHDDQPNETKDLDESIEVQRHGFCTSFVVGETCGIQEPIILLTGPQKRPSSMEKIGKMGRAVSKYFTPKRSQNHTL